MPLYLSPILIRNIIHVEGIRRSHQLAASTILEGQTPITPVSFITYLVVHSVFFYITLYLENTHFIFVCNPKFCFLTILPAPNYTTHAKCFINVLNWYKKF